MNQIYNEALAAANGNVQQAINALVFRLDMDNTDEAKSALLYAQAIHPEATTKAALDYGRSTGFIKVVRHPAKMSGAANEPVKEKTLLDLDGILSL